MEHTVRGILQARTLEWIAVPFSRGSSQPGDRTQVSHIAGVIPFFFFLQADSLPAEPPGKPINKIKNQIAQVKATEGSVLTVLLH